MNEKALAALPHFIFLIHRCGSHIRIDFFKSQSAGCVRCTFCQLLHAEAALKIGCVRIIDCLWNRLHFREIHCESSHHSLQFSLARFFNRKVSFIFRISWAHRGRELFNVLFKIETAADRASLRRCGDAFHWSFLFWGIDSVSQIGIHI